MLTDRSDNFYLAGYLDRWKTSDNTHSNPWNFANIYTLPYHAVLWNVAATARILNPDRASTNGALSDTDTDH